MMFLSLFPPSQESLTLDRVAASVVEVGPGGSGFAVGDGSLIATCEHCVRGDGKTVVRTRDGREIVGVVIRRDEANDVAILRIPTKLRPLRLGFVAHVGTRVAVIGHPYGLRYSVSTGVVSGLRRDLDVDGIPRRGLIQTDAGINPGNSGGPIVTLDGVVVGMASATTGANSIAFGVHVGDVRRLVFP